MRENDSGKQPIDRLATGIRMTTVVVVLGTLAVVWHPGMHGTTSGNTVSVTAAPAAAAGNTDTTYFPSRFPAPQNVEAQPPTF